ncbi:MAG TPA: hypothetical protein ENJ67_05895 [Sulfurimonas autotrophica]|uniref:Lipoprotein n=1 Tax=Sulfurimonas autotrophica TaxID=202747 RepID=A0A7C3FYR2_9BACT|nr:hypothetical protein [Sulfurimonas autotrophica]
MYKILLPFSLALVFSACAHVKITAAMCDQIASDPNAQIPQECRDYDKQKAYKAFDKVVDDKKVSDKDLEFNREK